MSKAPATAPGREGAASEAMRRINRAWLAGRIVELEHLLHPDIVMVLPGFAGRVEGRQEFLAGFREFSENATIHTFHEHDWQVDVAGDTAVITYRYELVYEQPTGGRYRTTGRDMWVLERQRERVWMAVWRTMLDTEEGPTQVA